MRRPYGVGILGVALAALLSGCALFGSGRPVQIHEVADSDSQWTGVALSKWDRVFVNFPRWSDSIPMSVGELKRDGTVAPFPAGDWNTWTPGQDAGNRFVCVQSVYVDRKDRLWVLDAGNPMFKGVIEGGPKLYLIDLESDSVVHLITFQPPIVQPDSYLNDIRVDVKREYAYVTDSGASGLLVINLKNGQTRRVLTNHPSTRSENTDLVVGNAPWRRPDGSRPQVHADGIALDKKSEYVYYQALTGRTLYRVPTKKLRDASLDEDELGVYVEELGRSGASDGLLYHDGYVYLTSIEHNAIRRFTPEGHIEPVIQNPALAWPDSLALGPDGYIYLTTSQIHRGADPGQPYRILKFRPPK